MGRKGSQVRTGGWWKESDWKNTPHPILPNILMSVPAKFPLPCSALSLRPLHTCPQTYKSNPLLTLLSSDPIVSQHLGSPFTQIQPPVGTNGRPQAALCLTEPVPFPCRDLQCGLCWGLRSLQTIEQSGQRHGGFTGESWVASAGLLTLDSYLHGGLWSPLHSPALMATSHRRMKISWRSF